jgi:hypothetical protein
LEETGEGDVTIVSGLLRSIDAGGFVHSIEILMGMKYQYMCQ